MYRLAFRKPYKSALQKTLQQQSLKQCSSKNHSLPPNVQQAGFGKLVLFLTPVAAVGGAITYAKNDKDFRKLLEENVPGAESLLKMVLEDGNAFSGISKQIDNVKKQFDNVSKSIEDATSTVTEYFTSPVKETPKKIEDVKSKAPAEKQASSPNKIAVKPAEPKPSNVRKADPVEPLPVDILELEKAVEVAATLAVKEYNKAISVLQSFNNDVRTVVDRAVENVDNSLWMSLRNRTSARDTAVSVAEKAAREALEKIEKCEIALSKVADAKNHEQVLAVRNKIKTFMDHINNVKDELYKTKDTSNMSEKYWRNVEKARNYFIDEIESIFPGLNIAEKKLNLSKEDLDLFIMHAYSHVLAYQKELQRLQTDGELRLRRAIDSFREDGSPEAIKAQLEYNLETEKRKLALENQRKIFQIRADAEKQLRHQLKQQAEAHMDHLTDAIAMKETELKRSFSRELEDKLSAEKANYKLQLAAMCGKMRGMDAALQARADAERSAHQAQALWAACQALWATVRTGEPGVHWKNKLRPLKSEIGAVFKVAEGDELVAVVLKNLPREAEERGVFPEDALRERFLNVERLARKVALVPESGANIPVYILSYLQSVFILKPDEPISKDELQNKKFDYSKLDTYDILNRARYFIDRGDLMQALKYMNLLQGAPRKIAADWLKETRLLLETQQAANTLMAHAAASGLLYL